MIFPLNFTSNGNSYSELSTSYGYSLYYDDTVVHDAYNTDNWTENNPYKSFTITEDQDGSHQAIDTCSYCSDDSNHILYDLIVKNTNYTLVNNNKNSSTKHCERCGTQLSTSNNYGAGYGYNNLCSNCYVEFTD